MVCSKHDNIKGMSIYLPLPVEGQYIFMREVWQSKKLGYIKSISERSSTNTSKSFFTFYTPVVTFISGGRFLSKQKLMLMRVNTVSVYNYIHALNKRSLGRPFIKAYRYDSKKLTEYDTTYLIRFTNVNFSVAPKKFTYLERYVSDEMLSIWTKILQTSIASAGLSVYDSRSEMDPSRADMLIRELEINSRIT